MNKANGLIDRINIVLGIVLLAAMMGCVGYVGGGYGGAVVIPEPGLFFYNGFYDRGPVVYGYSHRGYESRAWAHGGHR